MRGRKPIPTELKILHGNPGRRPLPKHEPHPRTITPRAPAHLDSVGQRKWRQTVAELAALNLLTTLDLTALESFCVLYSRAYQADESLKATGMLIKTSNGNIVQNPLIGISNRAHLILAKYETEFGMTPSSRARIQAPEMAEEDALDAILS